MKVVFSGFAILTLSIFGLFSNPVVSPTQDLEEVVQSDEQETDQEQEQEKPKFEFDFEPVKTAEQLLAKMEKDKFLVGGKSELPAEEIEKVVEVLRERYPFRSLEHRLSQFPKLRTKKVESEEPTQHTFFHSSTRTEALQKLHSEEVAAFINTENSNGLSRMRTISPYDLEIQGRWAKRIENRPVGSDLLAEPIVKMPAKPEGEESWQKKYSLTKSGLPTDQLTNFFHEYAVSGFVGSYTFGYVKSPAEVAGFEAHQVRFDEAWNGSLKVYSRAELAQYEEKPVGLDTDWKVNQFQLVSLLLHDEPRVYVADELPNMEELSGADVETRALNDFEKVALEKLRKGETVVSTATPNRLVMLGALRADVSCMQCHSVNQGDLLGAFSYEFLRDPKVEWKSRDF